MKSITPQNDVLVIAIWATILEDDCIALGRHATNCIFLLIENDRQSDHLPVMHVDAYFDCAAMALPHRGMQNLWGIWYYTASPGYHG